MSWDNFWNLPNRRYAKEEIDRAVPKALRAFEGVFIAPPDPEMEEFAEDIAADDAETENFEYRVRIPARWLADLGDEPDEEPDDDGFYSGVFFVSAAGESDDSARWQIHVPSNEAQNRNANLAVGSIAGAVSVILGGSEDPEPI